MIYLIFTLLIHQTFCPPMLITLPSATWKISLCWLDSAEQGLWEVRDWILEKMQGRSRELIKDANLAIQSLFLILE